MLVFSGVLTGLVVLTTVITPDWYQPIFRPNFSQGLIKVLDGPGKSIGIRLNTTLLEWLKSFQVPEMMQYIIYGIIIIACLVVVVRMLWKSVSFMEIMIVTLLVSLAITPYALQYDYPPLTVCLFAGLAAFNKEGPKLVPIFISLFIASILFWERLGSDGYWIVISIGILTFLGAKGKSYALVFEHEI